MIKTYGHQYKGGGGLVSRTKQSPIIGAIYIACLLMLYSSKLLQP